MSEFHPRIGAGGPRFRDALADATRVLAQAGCDTPRLDAELLLAEAVGVDRARLVLDADSPLDGAAAERFAAFVARRADREPVAYILGRKDFRHITLRVDPRVLIPRPETELLVGVGLTLPERARVVDVGTGSGAVALALKHERSDLVVTGTDVSEDALAVARWNAERLALDVTFVHTDMMDGVAGPFAVDGVDAPVVGDRVGGSFDAVLANLPYVADGEELAPEIARYEPAAALYAGPDGLDVIRRLIQVVGGAPRVPLVALEVGAGQADAVRQLLQRAGFGSTEALRDLAGHDRVVVGEA
jgi:release factor glutamine methyltransferase